MTAVPYSVLILDFKKSKGEGLEFGVLFFYCDSDTDFCKDFLVPLSTTQ